MSLLPLPKSVVWREGAFALPETAAIAWQGPDAARGVAELLAEYLRDATGLPLPVREGSAEITLVQTSDPAPDADGFLPETYTLDVAPPQPETGNRKLRTGFRRHPPERSFRCRPRPRHPDPPPASHGGGFPPRLLRLPH